MTPSTLAWVPASPLNKRPPILAVAEMLLDRTFPRILDAPADRLAAVLTAFLAAHEVPTGPEPHSMTISANDGLLALELATKNAQLRAQLAEAQDQCVEPAVDAGELHAEVQALRAQLAEAERDAWRAKAALP